MSDVIFIADIAFAVTGALIINKHMLRLIGTSASVWTGPVTEECMKTIPAFLLGLPILGVHICFGIVEAAYEIWQSPSHQTVMAGIMAIITHAVFGVVTMVIYRFIGKMVLALALATLLHMAWNRVILYFSLGGSA